MVLIGKVSPQNILETKKTPVAFLTRFLVSILVIPVRYNSQLTSATFSFFSVRTIGFFIIYYLLPLSACVGITMWHVDFCKDLWIALGEIYQPFDQTSCYVYNFSLIFGVPIMLLFVSYAFAKVSTVSLAQDLKIPKNINFILLQGFSSVVGTLLTWFASYQSLSPKLLSHPWFTRFFVTFFAPSFLSVLSMIYLGTCMILISAWIHHVREKLMQTPGQNKTLAWASNCLLLYQNIQEGLGPYFLICLPLGQVMWIFSLYLAITLPIGSGVEDNIVHLYSISGFLFASLGFLFGTIATSFPCDDLHASLGHVIDRLEDLPNAGEDREVAKLIKCLERTGPLTGYGLFKLERSTLTSMVSTSITYLIILVQFKLSLV